MSQPARHLHSVDPETGEILTTCPGCLERDDEIQGLKTESRGWRTRYQNLKRDKDAEAAADQHWGKAVALWQEWRVATGRVKSRWSADRFWLCKPFLVTDGFVVCRWAVWGIAYEPNTKQLPSGLVEVYSDWELCFRNRGTFERYARRGYANPVAREQFELREKGVGLDDGVSTGNQDKS